MQRQIIQALSLIAIISLTSCSSDDKPDPTYVSPTAYQHYNCKQIAQERARVSKKIDILLQTDATSQVLNTAVAAFAISQGYSIGGGRGKYCALGLLALFSDIKVAYFNCV